MTTRLFTSALFAGLLAGLIAVLLQFAFVEALILEAEDYESGARVHFAGGAPEAATGAQTALAGVAGVADHPAEEPGQGLFSRFALAFSAVFLSYVGWALLLVAGLAIAARFGQRITLQTGLLWGVAGFASVNLLPGIGLPPELPGIPAAELGARQLWWLFTVVASAGALALFAYGRKPALIAVGAALIVAPHVIGAPRLDGFAGIVPPELSAEFVSRSLAETMAAWVTLGLAAAWFWNRRPGAA